jgi:uncharacterized protein (DUF433 family)
LARHLLPQHPHVEVVESRSGPRAVVRGTRVGVDVVVGYGRRQAKQMRERLGDAAYARLTGGTDDA